MKKRGTYTEVEVYVLFVCLKLGKNFLVNEKNYLPKVRTRAKKNVATLGLDIVIAKEIRTMIKELAQEGKKGVLLTTHYISEAEELCDYIYVLDKGRMIAQGTKEELKDLFASEPKMVLQEPGLEEILMKIIYRSRGEDSEENIFGNKSRN